MRNIPKQLTTYGLENVCRVSAALWDADTHGYRVRVTYVKRDGSQSESTGILLWWSGDYRVDTFSVTVSTGDKGYRTINVARILDVWVL